MGDILAKTNREVIDSNQDEKGFVLLTLTKTQAKGEWVTVSTVMDKAYTTKSLKTFTADHGANGVGPLRRV